MTCACTRRVALPLRMPPPRRENRHAGRPVSTSELPGGVITRVRGRLRSHPPRLLPQPARPAECKGSMDKRLLKRHKRQVSRAKGNVKLSEPDLRTPEQIK